MEKRHDLATMARLTREFVSQSEDKLYARLVLYYHADTFLHGGEHSLTLPADLADYIFLEADGLTAIRCKEAQVPLMGGVVGPFSKQVVVTLTFDLPKGASERLQRQSGTVKFVVGGLGFEHNTIRYDLPLAALTADAPAELQRLYRAVAQSKP